MKPLFVATIAILSCACLAPLGLAQSGSSAARADQTNYFRQYSRIPIPVYDQSGGNAGRGRLMYLVGRDTSNLFIKFDPNSPEEVGMPLDRPGLKLNFERPAAFDKAQDLIRAGQFDAAVETLRPIAYPLSRYMIVSNDKFNIHEVVERFVYALVESNYTAEAVEFLRRLRLDDLSPVFIDHAMLLVIKLVESGGTESAMAILQQIPVGGDQEALFRRLFVYADDLRESRAYDEALKLYERLTLLPDPEIKLRAQLWTAYCNARLGRSEVALVHVRSVGDLDRDNPLYSLLGLVTGLLEFEKGEYRKAMEHISQAVVFIDMSQSWAPELMFTSGFCYEQLGAPDTAKEVYAEVELFYPKSIWAEESRLRLEAIDAPAPDTVEQES